MSRTFVNGSVSASALYELAQLFRCWGEQPHSREAVQLQQLLTTPTARWRFHESLIEHKRPAGAVAVKGSIGDLDFIEQVAEENIEHLVESGDREYAFLLAAGVEELRNCEVAA